MANRLKMAKVNGINTLAEQGMSQRQIAETLGVNRRTVARHLQPAGPKCTTSAPGSGASAEDSKCTTSAPGSQAAEAGSDRFGSSGTPPSRSLCEPFREAIQEALESGLSAQRIFQDLRTEHGFQRSYDSVKRFIRQLKNETPLPFRRIECEPGWEAQVDFGMGAPLIDAEGKRRRTHVLRVILSHSRKGHSESVLRQTTDDFIQCLENAFHYFQGVPRTLVIDNLRAAVSKADWYDPELNSKVEAFARHYGITILPTKPRTPRHKGKVERGVGYVQENALKGKTFSNLHEQNQYLLHWEEAIADTRIHGTTKKQVGRSFREEEQPHLLPLPLERFPSFHDGKRRVNRDGHIEVAKAYYSLPPEYLGHSVWARWDARTVRVFDLHMKQITLHARQPAGKRSTHPAHIATEKINNVERGAEWLLKKARVLGPETARWSVSMIAARGIAGVRPLQGLLALTSKYSSAEIETACHIAWSHQSFQLRTIRKLLKHASPAQETFSFMDEHPIIRPLSEYGELVRQSFQGGTYHA